MVTRRTVLQLAGITGITAVTGCTAIASNSPAAAPENESSPSERTSPPDATHRIEVTASDDPADLPVRPEVSTADPYATSGSPPVLRVDVENPTDARVVVGEYRSVVFQYATGGEALVLLPHSERSTDGEPDRESPGYETTKEGCWQLTSHPAVTLEYGTVAIPSNGMLTAFVGVYGSPDATSCLPTGEHRFEETYAHFSDGQHGEPSTTERWGFSLAVERL